MLESSYDAGDVAARDLVKVKRRTSMKCLTVDTPHATYEFHTLNPGERMEGFGGSKTGLVAGKTASLILRTESNSGTCQDVENDINSPNVWSLIANLINDSSGVLKATTR